MLVILFAWLYISLICLIWGNLFLNIINKSTSSPVKYEFPVICMAGLAMAGTLALYLSVFLPLDGKAHIIIALPSLIYCLRRKNRHTIRMQIAELVKSLSWQAYVLLLASILMVLVISSYSIAHPDTLSYHAQSIQWLQQYRPVPGIMHLRRELGFQSLWFALQAIFTPQIASVNTFFPLSGCVLCWYFIFIIRRIDGSRVKKAGQDTSGTTAWGWVLLLLYTLISWTQVRLTAASTSPDFIVALYILAAFYSFNQSYRERSAGYSYLLLTVLFCSSAFAIKLSAIVILLLVLFIILRFYRNRNWGGVAFCICLSALIIIPVLIRNIMVTGYPLYPSSFAGFFNTDWKFSEARMNEFEQYITTYARLLPPSQTMIGESLQLPFAWINIWWQRIAIVDQLLIVAAIAGIMLDLAFLKQVIQKAVKQQMVIFLVAIAGTLFWFIKAPDPRFGTGFLIVLVYASYYPLPERIGGFLNKKASLYSNKIITACLFIVIISYTAWRFLNLFEPGQILLPKGIQKVNYRPVDWHHIRVNLTENRNPCGTTPVPCVTDSSLLPMPRGETIDAGFRAR